MMKFRIKNGNHWARLLAKKCEAIIRSSSPEINAL
jgi:hypothetical protein